MSSVIRGQVVLVDFPYSDGRQSKIRPALVVQADAHNRSLIKTIIALITGNLRRRGHPAHILLDPVDEPIVGINGPSLVSCINLYTVEQSSILRVIGQLTPELQSEVDLALGHTLQLPIATNSAP
ncbi:MAG: type II toxin-antitoxin system PemK/MazF family toxin [Planctomycetaceae bacterium]|nr:type II toxin-antitoxin system PemK/MazF family toxin [Planctomycetaceae bacterium]